MKSCVVTKNFACDPSKVWLYLSKPALNHWCAEVERYEESSDGMQATEYHKGGTEVKLTFTRKEKNRCMSGSFAGGKVRGTFTVLLLGGGDSTSVECTVEIEGLGLFAKANKPVDARLEQLRKAVGV